MYPFRKSIAAILTAVALCVLLSFSACKSSKQGPAGTDFNSAKDNAVVFSVKGIEVKKSEIMKEAEKLKPATFQEDTKAMNPQEIQNILNEFIIQAYKTIKANVLFQVYANENNIVVTEEDVNETVNKFKAMIESNWATSELSFEDVLKRHNISYDDFLSDMRKQTLQEMVMKSAFEAIEITDEELQGFYEERYDRYNQEEGVHLHIINAESMTEAQQILGRIHAGADFHDVARDYTPPEDISEDKAPPGDAGPIAASKIPPAIAEQIFSPGRKEMEPFIASFNEGQEMVFVIRIKEFIPAEHNPLEAIHEYVYKDLMEEKKFHATEKFIQDLQKIYTVTENYPPPPSAYSQMMQQMPPMP